MHHLGASTTRYHRESLHRLAGAASQAELIDELDQRLAMMIRGASKDQQTVNARNVGKYEGAILQQREEVKRELLQQLPSDLEAMCKALPAFLRSTESDLEKLYPEELAIIRKRPLAKR